MDKDRDILSRRDVLKLITAGLGAIALKPEPSLGKAKETVWPTLAPESLPQYVRSLMEASPNCSIDSAGYLNLLSEKNESVGAVPFTQTLWNKQRNSPEDRIRNSQRTGIVLHWFGDNETYDRTVKGYLRGFDSLRMVSSPVVEDYETITSAHFLIGDNPAVLGEAKPQDSISILQTQKPNESVPTLASHLQPLDYEIHRRKKQYFVRSLYQIGYEMGLKAGNVSLLQELFDGPEVDPNYRTLAVEITGQEFDSLHPSEQKTANSLSVVWALMKAYNVRAVDLLGHNEIQRNKPDPGRQFMAEVRFLIGVKAVLENDPQMNELVFGQFLKDGDSHEAVRKYFQFVRQYLVLSTYGYPEQVFAWEKKTKYWQVYDSLFRERPLPVAGTFEMPVVGNVRYGNGFLNPPYHEGVDINTGAAGVINSDLGTPIKSIAAGECIFAEQIPGAGLGRTIIIRHRLPEGSEVISLYGHLDTIGVEVGDIVRIGKQIATMGNSGGQADSHLHLALAYGATWDTDLAQRPFVPQNVGENWILRRYLEPISFIKGRLQKTSE